jgi:hypothetical protein
VSERMCVYVARLYALMTVVTLEELDTTEPVPDSPGRGSK